LWLPLAAHAAPALPADPVQAHVDAVHAESAALRRQLLKAWTFEADATPTQGYYSQFAAAPIQHIIAAMALNENKTAVALAQTALANPNMSSHFGAVYEWTSVARAFAMFNSKSGWTSVATMRASTEECMKNMTFHYAVKSVGADKFCGGVPPSQGGGSMCTSGSENLDYDAKSSGYIALRELSKFVEYKDRPLGVPVPPTPPGPTHLPRCNHCCKAGCGLKCCSPEPPAPQKCCCLARDANVSHCPVAPSPPPVPRLMTVSEAVAEWDEYFYNKLKHQALSGLFSENGSPNYWYRTWPAIFNLADFGSPRVRQRAKMFIDLAFIEGDSLQVGGFRAGAKMRAKKDGGDYPCGNTTSPIVAYQAGMGRCAGDAMKPVLLGTGGPPVWKYADGQGVDTPPVWWPHFASAVIEMQTSAYNMSATVVMLRARTTAQKAARAEFTLQNRLLGETNQTHPSAGLSLNSSIVHHFYRTASFGLGSIFFNPAKQNATFGAPPQESMVELVFANEDHSAVGIPHASGPKWSAQEGGALITAQCTGALGCIARYAGDFSTEIYNVSAVHRREAAQGDWIFVEPSNGLEAWAAVRYAWGGLNESVSSVREGVIGSGNRSFQLVPTDPTAPLVLFAGNGSTFGSLQQFMGAVLQADLSVSKPAADGTRVVTFVPPAGSKPCPELCRPITFPWSLTQATLKMPSVGGKALVDQPSLAYDGPFMMSTLGSATVRTSSGDGDGAIREEFDFSTDRITRLK
jgi:hypothetical protein